MARSSGLPSELMRAAKLARATRTAMLSAYRPYPKQRQFHALGARYRQRAMLAGNRCGKSRSGGMELAIHATGRYPDWWQGRRFSAPITAWYANEKLETVRDVNQAILLGEGGSETFGTGTVPKDALGSYAMGRGIPGLVDWFQVKHVSGGWSLLKSKAYNEGRTPWQGATLDAIWYDEEPPAEIYSEGWIRLATKNGICWLTMTPLLGMTQVVGLFYPEPTTTDRVLVQMTLDEAEHFTDEQRRQVLENLPAHEREARSRGTPMLGSGRIFPIAEDAIVEDGFEVPRHWRQIVGMDFGLGDHPTGAVLLAFEGAEGPVHVVRDYRASEPNPGIHALALRAWGERVPVAWPHDGHRIGDVQSTTPLSGIYRKHGLAMLPEHATFEVGGYGVDAGVQQMLEWMQTGRWKVFRTCQAWLEEFRLYHRKSGAVVKERDDVVSASRYAFMMRRYARSVDRDELGSLRYPAEAEGMGASPFGTTPLRGR